MTQPRGGSFLLEAVDPTAVATPEDLTPEERSAGEAAREFVTREVLPRLEAMERHDWATARALLAQAGELGLLGAEVPEAYGGLGLRKLGAVPITEEIGREGSFAVTFGAQTGIGTLPIVYFGTPSQKQRYLPALASGRLVAAYSLTEPEAGSDAMSIRTVARHRDGGWVLRGQKQWTTNAGFADLFVIYAKVDGEHFTAFLVERGTPGLQVGPEAKKMGIHGSSTASVFLDDAYVPADAVLHEVGRGHHVAFNILNLGRFRLGAGCSGSCRHLLRVTTGYVQQRQQFGRPLATFPLVREKLARMAVLTYALESAVYRVAGLLDRATSGVDLSGDAREASARALAEYAVECSIVKVLGTEALDQVVDEAVQLHGGYGYMQEYEVERAYRDSRINRIFEGTNEINRLLIPGTVMRRAVHGALPVLPRLRELPGQLLARTAPEAFAEPLVRAEWQVETLRLWLLAVAGLASERYMAALEHEQELLALLADLAILLFAGESAVARARRLQRDAAQAAEAAAELACAYTEEAFGRAEQAVRTALAYLARGDELRTHLATVRKLARIEPVDLIGLRRRIAERVLAAGGYPLR